MTRELLPAQTDLLTLVGSVIVAFYQVRHLGERVLEAKAPERLKRKIAVLLRDSHKWGGLLTILALMLGGATKELSTFALRRLDLIIIDLWMIHEIDSIMEKWSSLAGP